MAYKCGVCKERVEGDLVALTEHTETHIVDLIKHDFPEWVDDEGVCENCLSYYRGELEGGFFKDAKCALRRRKAKGFLSFFKNIFKG